MDTKMLAVFACALLLAGAATAAPGSAWRRASEDESSPDRDVEVVEPVRSGGSRGGLGGRGGVAVPAEASDESPEVVPFGIVVRGGLGGFGGLGGLGGFGGPRPVIVRTLAQPGPRDSADEDSDEDLPGGYVSTGYLHPYFVDPMSNFMAQMAEMMAAMRRQMTQVLNRGADAGADGPDFSKLGNTTSTTKAVAAPWWPLAHRFSPPAHRLPLPPPPPPRRSPLSPWALPLAPPAPAPPSVTWRRVVRPQVVDGHVVTVNETVIGGGDGDGVLHVRVIDIHPSEGPATEDADESPAAAPTPAGAKDADRDQDRDVEPLESSNEVTAKPRRDNEIPMKVGSEVDDLNG